MNQNEKFQINGFVVYPSHGVGQIVDKENQSIAGTDLSNARQCFQER